MNPKMLLGPRYLPGFSQKKLSKTTTQNGFEKVAK